MEQFTGLLGEYYRETEPAARKALYARLQGDAALPPLFGRLYELRYVDPRNPGNEVDLFLWHLVNLQQYNSAPGLLKKKTRQDVLAALRRMGLDTEAPPSPEEEPYLYWELRNACRRYFGTFTAASYGRKLFGVLAGKEEEKSARMREDARKLSYGNAEKFDLKAETALFCRAVDEEFMAFFQTDRSLAEP